MVNDIEEKLNDKTPLGILMSILTSFDTLNRYLELELMQYDVTPIRFRVMSALYKEGTEMTPSEIAKSVFRAKNSITSVINKMVKQGVVNKNNSDTDGRSVNIAITEKGWQEANMLQPVAQQVSREILSCLDKDQVDSLINILRTIRNHVSEKIEGQPGKK
ncbi:MarR family winged helix-turn-helix transcriptional regulator [Thermodesulfobacteriota bacterium]